MTVHCHIQCADQHETHRPTIPGVQIFAVVMVYKNKQTDRQTHFTHVIDYFLQQNFNSFANFAKLFPYLLNNDLVKRQKS